MRSRVTGNAHSLLASPELASWYTFQSRIGSVDRLVHMREAVVDRANTEMRKSPTPIGSEELNIDAINRLVRAPKEKFRVDIEMVCMTVRVVSS